MKCLLVNAQNILIDEKTTKIVPPHAAFVIALQNGNNTFNQIKYAVHTTSTIKPLIILNNLKFTTIPNWCAYMLIHRLRTEERKQFKKDLREKYGIEKLLIQKQLMNYGIHNNLITFTQDWDLKFIYKQQHFLN